MAVIRNEAVETFYMRKRIFKIGARIMAILGVMLVLFVFVSLLVIDRGEPAVTGLLSAGELESIRGAVRSSAIEIPIHWVSVGEVSASWHFTKELYTYRISSVEVVDTNTVLVFTKTNYYPDGLRRPDFFVRRIDGRWQAAAPGPVL